MPDLFDDAEWQKLFEEWSSEAEEYAVKKRKFDQFIQHLEKAKEPFRKKEQDLRRAKRERGESDELSAEERCQIWQGFDEIQRRIIDEIYGKE
jgi:hypothetical protein